MSNNAAMTAKELELTHIGAGHYVDKKGVVKYKSIDGINLVKIDDTDIKKTNSKLLKIAIQNNPVMPNPLGDPSGVKPIASTTKKKKSLVEFVQHKKLPEWSVKYQLYGTGKKIHLFDIDAVNQHEAFIKAKNLLHGSRIVGMPQLKKSK